MRKQKHTDDLRCQRRPYFLYGHDRYLFAVRQRLSNAIESVSDEPLIDNRCIGVTVQSAGDMLFIHVENYFSGEIELENGLPVTRKDRDYHGFGMKSMERIAYKYGGEISVVAAEEKFNLDVILPIPKKKVEN